MTETPDDGRHLHDGDCCHDARVIHIDIPKDAPADEVEAFEDAVAKFVHDLEPRGQWDPFMHSHVDACDESDHCHGPGSNVESRFMAAGWEMAADALRPEFPEAVARLNRQKIQP